MSELPTIDENIYCKYCKLPLDNLEDKKTGFCSDCHKIFERFNNPFNNQKQLLEYLRSNGWELWEIGDNYSENRRNRYSYITDDFVGYRLNNRGFILELYLDFCINHPNTKLNEFPSQIFQLPYLTILTLRNNNIQFIPKKIIKCKKLEILDLANNNISSLPKSFDKIPFNLKFLNLENNNIKTLPYWVNHRSPYQINLDGNNLSVLPSWSYETFEEFFPYQNNQGRLTKIELHDLDNFPIYLCGLKYLEELNLTHITSLPEMIGNLTNLEYLDLSHNTLTSLPESIGNLPNLGYLDLSDISLTSLPETIGNLLNLEFLNLSYNSLTSLPESIGNLPNLKSLNLSHNSLTSLPETIGNLPHLEFLDLSHNSLTFLPETIINLKYLYTFHFQDNKLVSISEAIRNFVKRIE
ncbi:MAG: leucine-rich repeat domain-containing protein [Candidatus Hodarchaeales archaeon]